MQTRLAHRSLPLPFVLLLAFAAQAAELPFAFLHHGEFRRIHHRGDASGQVALSSLPQAPGHWGLGALAGLRGEIVQVDGRLLVSLGSDPTGRLEQPAAAAQAALFAGARVAAWRDVPVPRDLDRGAFEDFVQEQAKAHGLGLDRPFPFRLEGSFPRLEWHVVGGGKQHAPGGHGGSHAERRLFRQDGATGQLVAIYTGTELEGVVSHPGERFHLHFVDAGITASGHVDHYGVAAGSILKLPIP
jgi:alpha-acetolactate decarboxylase